MRIDEKTLAKIQAAIQIWAPISVLIGFIAFALSLLKRLY